MRRSISAFFVVLILAIALIVKVNLGGGLEDCPNYSDISNVTMESTQAPSIVQQFSCREGFFIENRGQMANPEVLFYAEGDPLSVGLTKESVLFIMRESLNEEDADPVVSSQTAFRETAFIMRIEGNNGVEPKGMNPYGHTTHFYIGNDSDAWIRGVLSYQEVLYEGIYDNVDLRFYFKDGMFKYDLVLWPGADSSSILLQYEGVQSISIDSLTGDLLIASNLGIIRDMKPIVFQMGSVDSPDLDGWYRLISPSTIGFTLVGELSSVSPTVIDPGLQFSTYLGGSGEDAGEAVTIDGLGNIHLVGVSKSTDFLTIPGTLDRAKQYYDIFGVILDPSGSSLIGRYIIGGSETDSPSDVHVMSDGSIIIGGTTRSWDFPIDIDALDTDLEWSEGFFLKLAKNADSLLYSSFFGGNGNDFGASINIGDDGSIYLSGTTYSTDLPTSQGAFCTTCRSNAIYVLKTDSTMKNISYCTYIDGTDSEYCLDTYIDSSGNTYIVGQTQSSGLEGFPVTSGAFCTTKSFNLDCYILKLDPTGSSILFGTYLGGRANEWIFGIEVAQNGSVFAAGYTDSFDFPVTPGAHSTERKLDNDAFLVVLDSNLSVLQYGTYFGGNGSDRAHSLALSPTSATVYISGRTTSGDLPVTKGTFDPLFRGDEALFTVGFNLTNYNLTYCTYIGGQRRDQMVTNKMFCDDQDFIYITGGTNSTDFPVTSGAYCATFGGGEVDDAFLLKLDPRPCIHGPDPPVNLSAVAGDGFVDLAWEQGLVNRSRVVAYRIHRGPSSESLTEIKDVGWSTLGYNDTNVTNGNLYYYAISSIGSAGEGPRGGPVTARPMGPPAAPLNLTAETGAGTVDLSWSPPNATGGELLGYHVLRGFSISGLEMIASLGTVYEYEDTDVETGVMYFYAIVAFNSVGNGTRSEAVPIIPVAPPSEPRSLTVIPGDTRVELSWKAPADDGGSLVQGYRLYWGTSRDAMSLLEETGLGVLSHTETGLENGRLYYFYATAYNNEGEGPPTLIEAGRPFGHPSEPLDVDALSGDRRISLSWSPPLDNNGRPITDYKLFFGQSPSNLEFSKNVGNVTSFLHVDLINGVTYYYQVVAINEAGEGARSDIKSATPMVLPGVPTDFEAVSVLGGVQLGWTLPTWTGTGKLIIRVKRGPEGQDLETLVDLEEATEYLDDGVDVGTTYKYQILAINPAGSEGLPTEVKTINVSTIPGAIDIFDVTPSDGEVRLTWSPPVSDGGTPITGYVVLGGILETNLEVLSEQGVIRNYTDTMVQNGRTYYYSVYAVNAIGKGPRSIVLPANPLGSPGAPWFQNAKYENGKVVLSWTAPSAAGTVNETGYVVLRGSSRDDLEPIANVGMVTEYVDEDIQKNRRYFYAVVATSELGDGEQSQIFEVKTEEDKVSTWLLPLLIIVLVVLVVAGYVWARGRREPETVEAVAGEEEVVVEAAVPEGPRYIVEKVFVIFRDGRLMAECAQDECKTRDADLMSGMLIAVQGIVQDGLDAGGALESIKYGDNLIQIATGRHVNLAAIVYGEPEESLKDDLEATVRRIEVSYSGVIEQWIGDLSTLKDVDKLVAPLLERTAHLTREDIGGPAVLGGVSMLSAVDFFRGYVRLKVAVVNSTEEAVMDATVEVHYDHDMLRLERVKPKTLVLRGDQVSLGNIRPEERKTVAFLWDPQICQGTHLDGTLMYYDSKGELHRMEMKRRHADVVCPIFFTRKHANTAMLRRLISEKLHMSDLRLFRYPATMSPSEVIELGKSVMGHLDVQLVREYIEEGPPFEAEVWYYGETKVKGYELVMRLGVVETKSAMEFFAASTDMEPITGLLAEFRREIDQTLRDRYAGEVTMEPEHDEEFRRDLEGRTLLVDRMEDIEDLPAEAG
jgi:fibronectin type 3 domain-containing protein